MYRHFDSQLAKAIQTQELDRWRGIHRRPKEHQHRKQNVLVAAVVAVAALSQLSSGTSHPMQAQAAATVEATPQVEFRGSTVDRAVRVTATRTQRINAAINYALAQRGDRYRFGAMGPSKWDCSGLVKKSFAKAGVALPHYTGGIQKKGKRISRKNLQRGDIVFPQRGHVGIYLGGGKMIVASSGHGKVMIQKVYGFYTARRVL